MAEHEFPKRTGETKKKVVHGANFGVYIAVVIAIIVLCNWFVSRNDHHLDLTPNKMFSLSPQTHKILKGLDEPVTIYVFDRQSGFRQRRDLMKLYSSASKDIHVKYVDPNRDPGLAHGFGVENYGSIYVSAGSHHLRASDASEQGISNALIRLLKGEKMIYFVQGHGERDLAGIDRDGYSKLKQALQNEDSEVEPLVLMQKMQIPANCSALVIAGPKSDYLPPEVSAIQKYLEGGGRVLMLLDPGVALPNLSKLLSNYNVTLRNDLVIDENPVGQIFGTGPSMPLILSYGDNPIVQPLKRTATLFPLARSFGVSGSDKSGVTVDALCKTSDASFGVTNFNASMKEVSYRPGKDIKGPLTVAVAVTLTGSGPAKQGRLVATGTSLLASNAYLGFQGNRDLVMNMVEWLTSNEGLISIRPKVPGFQHLNLTASQMGGLLLRVLAIPVCVIVIGIGVWWSRR
ncbi:MAG: GldG family protein [Terriglobia bacterium]